MTGEVETFDPPLFQTWVMFLGMMFALPAHFVSEWYKGYKLQANPAALAELRAEQAKVTSKTYMLLAIPSVFDLLATVTLYPKLPLPSVALIPRPRRTPTLTLTPALTSILHPHPDSQPNSEPPPGAPPWPRLGPPPPTPSPTTTRS